MKYAQWKMDTGPATKTTKEWKDQYDKYYEEAKDVFRKAFDDA